MRTFAQKQNQPQRPVSSSVAQPHTAKPGLHHRSDLILHLQRTIGNQAVQGILQAHAEELNVGLTGTASSRIGHDLSRIPTHSPAAGAIQTKLEINQPGGDVYEQEADYVSERVTRVPEPQLQRACACGNNTMAGGECSECRKKRLGLRTKLKVNEPGDIYEREADRVADQVMATPAHSAVGSGPPRIQRFAGKPTGQVAAAPASVDQALASPGRPLDPALRQDMEQRFGYDFSRVRVHSGTAAEQSARDVNAHAYTVGHNMVFGAGQPALGSREGQKLLAHELTHVMQQSTASALSVVQRQAGGGAPAGGGWRRPGWRRSGGAGSCGRSTGVLGEVQRLRAGSLYAGRGRGRGPSGLQPGRWQQLRQQQEAKRRDLERVRQPDDRLRAGQRQLALRHGLAVLESHGEHLSQGADRYLRTSGIDHPA